MGFNCGIVGLPNVGKSSLFNALTESGLASAENYPFCTIEPNRAMVSVSDERLDRLARLAGSAQIIPTQLEFVDIAGLVRGASQGEGLGNQFLSHIREVAVICHMLRCFDDVDVAHVSGGVDPLSDAEIVDTELLLADLQSMQKRADSVVKRSRSGDKAARLELALVEKCLSALSDGTAARFIDVSDEESLLFRQLNLLTAKPVLYVSNVDESSLIGGNVYSERVSELASARGCRWVLVSAAIEAEIAALPSIEERRDFMRDFGLEESGLSRVIRAAYSLLGRISFFTCGAKETRAWSVVSGTTADSAAGVIHTDFQRGFIAAETVGYGDYIAAGGEQNARDQGKSRLEGRQYVVKDGDVIHFRFNV